MLLARTLLPKGKSRADVEERTELSILRELYHRGRASLAATISRLYSLAAWSEALSEEERSAIYSLDAALDLADYGVRAKFEEFLACYTLPIPADETGVPARAT